MRTRQPTISAAPPTGFKNPWPSYTSSGLFSAFRTRINTPKNFVPVPADRLGLVTVHEPDFARAGQNGLKATWIGHASFLVETTAVEGSPRGMRMLLDPVWSNRVGPYGMVGPVRFTPPPCTVDELPHIDAVCISHDHYDHLDSGTLQKLMSKQNGDLRFFCGLGVKAVLTGLGAGITAEQITELDWWDGVTISDKHAGSVDLIFGSSKSHCLPARNSFFAGDTGYCHVTYDTQFSHHDASHPPCPAFKQIGHMYGPFDLALLPIGCFKPRSLLSGQHASPEDSLSIHNDVRSKKSIGMHYGTFRGGFSASYEPVTEPPKRWKEGVVAANLEWGIDVLLCDIGETVTV
ncbi:hypothetical protein N0V83_003904 [Neocucurbitaria cava]|uniref:Metallo-beta-lactamase domain-containing protein n=1 Tax=Neocucurbitaria cava TaxID=798079 RepID=A0A9W8Y9S0_9PLEO|nr:hypothetical protein N0V83_003904 [Neocucurbitaria cava]